MSHEIEGNNMFSVRQIPWHELGVVLPEAPTSAEAIKAAGMDWTVESKELFWRMKDQNLGVDVLEPVGNRVALVRNTDQKYLATVSKQYTPLQNSEAFNFFDPLIAAGTAKYETAGVLCEGRKVWILAKLDKDMDVGGDEVRSYLLLCNGHDGQTGVLVQPTPIRVVCNNTLTASLGLGKIHTFAHRPGVQMKLEEVKEALDLVIARLDNMNEIFQQMAKFPMTPEALNNYMNALFELEAPVDIPEEEKITDGEVIDRAEQIKLASKEKMLELHESGLGVTAATRGTMWGAYNAAVEFADYFMGKRSKDRGNYMLLGEGARFKSRAFALATK